MRVRCSAARSCLAGSTGEHFRAQLRLLAFSAVFLGTVLVHHAQLPCIHMYFNRRMLVRLGGSHADALADAGAATGPSGCRSLRGGPKVGRDLLILISSPS
jgi:hypothetical protein